MSPARMLQPPTVWCASCCVIDQYMYFKFDSVTLSNFCASLATHNVSHVTLQNTHAALTLDLDLQVNVVRRLLAFGKVLEWGGRCLRRTLDRELLECIQCHDPGGNRGAKVLAKEWAYN